MIVVAKVIFFHLEKDYDYLTIGDGDVEDERSVIAALTGNLKVSALASSMPNMWMSLTTDSTGQQLGYRFELEQIPATSSHGNLKGYSEIIAVITPSNLIKSEIYAFW